MADAAADKYGVPRQLFRALINQESGWNIGAVSKAGAVGLTQIMPGTAQGLGIDPTDPLQALDGGARYLAQQFAAFHSWPLALAAYNAGPGAVQAAGGGIPQNSETPAYVRSVMGASGMTGPGSIVGGDYTPNTPNYRGGSDPSSSTSDDGSSGVHEVRLASGKYALVGLDIYGTQKVFATYDSPGEVSKDVVAKINADQAQAKIDQINKDRDYALSVGDQALAVQKANDANYWEQVKAQLSGDSNTLTARGQDIDFTTTMAKLAQDKADSDNRFQEAMAGAKNDEERNKIAAAWNAEQANIAKMENYTRQQLGMVDATTNQFSAETARQKAQQDYIIGMANATNDAERVAVEDKKRTDDLNIANMQDANKFTLGQQQNQSGQFSAETDRAARMGQLGLDTDNLIAKMASDPRQIPQLFFMQRGITPDWDAIRNGNAQQGQALVPVNPMTAYTPTTAAPAFGLTAQQAAGQPPTGYGPTSNPFIGMQTSYQPTTQAPNIAAVGNNPFTATVGQATSYRPGPNEYITSTPHEATGQYANPTAPSPWKPTATFSPRPTITAPTTPIGQGTYTPPAVSAPPASAAPPATATPTPPANDAYHQGGNTWTADGSPGGRWTDPYGHYSTDGGNSWVNQDGTPYRMADGGFTTAKSFMTGDSLKADPTAGGAKPELVQNPTGAPLRVLNHEQTMQQADFGRSAGPQITTNFDKGGTPTAAIGDRDPDAHAGMYVQPNGNAGGWGTSLSNPANQGQSKGGGLFTQPITTGFDNGSTPISPAGGWPAPVFAPPPNPAYAPDQMMTPTPGSLPLMRADFGPQVMPVAQPHPQAPPQPMAQAQPGWLPQRAGLPPWYQSFLHTMMGGGFHSPHPRFALGTDNSAAYAGAGFGNQWIPDSSNAWLAGSGQNISPTLQSLADYGFPVSPALAYHTSGGVAPGLNLGAAATVGRQAGVIPSLQTLNRESASEQQGSQGYWQGPGGIPWADLVDFLGKTTGNLQTAQTSRGV